MSDLRMRWASLNRETSRRWSGTVTTVMPAARADCVPATESSKARQCSGAIPMASAATKKMSGAGLPFAIFLLSCCFRCTADRDKGYLNKCSALHRVSLCTYATDDGIKHVKQLLVAFSLQLQVLCVAEEGSSESQGSGSHSHICTCTYSTLMWRSLFFCTCAS